MYFSILMSIYHKENPIFLNQCFTSIWTEQTLKPAEIVLVKDGALTAELEQIIFTWQEKLGLVLKIVALEQNIGLGKALNAGLTQCSYDWVLRMDTDDIATPNRFQKQIDFIQKNPDVVLFSGQILEFNQDISDANVLKPVPIDYHEIKKFAQKRCPFNHMTVAYKKDVILELGGYQHHLFMEDYNLWLRVIGAGYKIANLPDVLLYARVGNGMHARRRGWQYIQSEKQLLDLKLKLKIQPLAPAVLLFLVRSAFRLLPSSLLGKVYNSVLRKSVKS